MNQEFENPLLLSVKMFLSEFPWIQRQEYKPPYHVCTHFTKEVVEEATKLQIRCACAIIYFAHKRVAHAIVAFDTDYGLVYIEPQSGEQEYIQEGKVYPSRLDETGDGDDVVSKIDLIWNDDYRFKWLECRDCGYVLPTVTITDYCLHCGSVNSYLINRRGGLWE